MLRIVLVLFIFIFSLTSFAEVLIECEKSGNKPSCNVFINGEKRLSCVEAENLGRYSDGSNTYHVIKLIREYSNEYHVITRSRKGVYTDTFSAPVVSNAPVEIEMLDTGLLFSFGKSFTKAYDFKGWVLYTVSPHSYLFHSDKKEFVELIKAKYKVLYHKEVSRK